MYDEEYTQARQDDIDEMNKTFDEGVVMIEDESEEEEETKEETKEEETSTEEGGEETEEEGETEEDEGKGEEDTEEKGEEATEEPDERDEIIEDLRAKLAAKEAEPKEEAEPEPEPEEIRFEPQDFISEEEFDDVTSDRRKLNEILNKVHQKAVLDTRKALGEGVLRQIPNIVSANVTALIKMKETHDKFYNDNKDLVPYKQFVGPIVEEVMAKNPGKSYDDEDVLKEVAKEARARLRLVERATKPKEEKGKPPKLPRKKSSSGRAEEKPKTDPLLEDIDKMNESIGR